MLSVSFMRTMPTSNAFAIAGIAGRYMSMLKGPIATSAPTNRIKCRGTAIGRAAAALVEGELIGAFDLCGEVSRYCTGFERGAPKFVRLPLRYPSPRRR